MAKTTPSGQNVLKVTLKDLVNAQGAMNLLGSRALVGKVSFKVGKALKQARAEIETFNDGNMILLMELGGKPSKMGGIELDQKDERYEKAWKTYDSHIRESLKTEVELTGVVTVTYDDLIKALPLPKVECFKCGAKMEYSDEEKAEKPLEPDILAALDWLIVE